MNGEHSAVGVHATNGEDTVNGEHSAACVHAKKCEDPVNGEHSAAGMHIANGEAPVNGEHVNGQHPTERKYPQPLKLSGALDQFESFHSTPCIGTEFPKANLVEWLRAPNSDELIRDLAITSTVPSYHSVARYH